MNLAGSAADDWTKAEAISNAPIRKRLFWLNQPLLWLEKKAIEPSAKWFDNADAFRIIERISPAIEALGVLAIPLVLFFATQAYQENLQQQEIERLQQQAVKDYLSQLSTILLDAEGDLQEPQNERLQVLTTATTLTLLREPNLDSERKGQIIKFLSQMDLVNREVVYGPLRSEDTVPALSLSQASLSNADLGNADLRFADLSNANLSNASLNNADLSNADLRGADLRGTDLRFADLSGADLHDADLRFASRSFIARRVTEAYVSVVSGADLRDADLSYASLRGASLRFADLRGTSLYFADLRGTSLRFADLGNADLSYTELSFADLSAVRNLTQGQIELALLCNTKLPKNINLDTNRDCEELKTREIIRSPR